MEKKRRAITAIIFTRKEDKEEQEHNSELLTKVRTKKVISTIKKEIARISRRKKASREANSLNKANINKNFIQGEQYYPVNLPRERSNKETTTIIAQNKKEARKRRIPDDKVIDSKEELGLREEKEG